MQERIEIVWDPDKRVVQMEFAGIPIGLAQMMVHEAGVQLDIMRRRMAALELAKEQAEAVRVAQLVGNSRFKG